MSAFDVLVLVIASLGGVLFLLSTGILANKAVREARRASDRRLRAKIEPALLTVVHAGEPRGVEAAFGTGMERGAGVGVGRDASTAVRRTTASPGADLRELATSGAAAEREARTSSQARSPGDVSQADTGPGREGPPSGAFRAALGGSPSGSTRRVAGDLLLDHAVRVRGIARDRLSQAFEELGYVDEYLHGLRAQRWWRRADSAEKLGLARSGRAIEPLVSAMTDPVSEVRLRAAKALGEIRGQAAVGPLIAALAQPNRWSTVRVADILSRMGPEAAEGIREAWPALPQPARLASLDILGKIHTLDAVDFLRAILESQDADHRARAAHALGMIGHAGPVGELVEALRDPEWSVRAMAAKALGRIGSPDAVEPLAQALKDDAWWVRSNAAMALRLLGPRGQKALIGVLDESDTYARHQAVLMLQESGVLSEFVAALDSDQDPERRSAEGLIRRLIALGRTDFLSDQAREYPNSRVRARLGELLHERPA